MLYSALLVSSLVALGSCHGVILGAVGIQGSPTSVGFGVNPEIARNCTSINPCQQDATLIRDAEINANIVNSCGRTELAGNIDVGENTENALAAGTVTQVQSGTELTVTIHQVNADGAGPYVCDMDPTSNAAFGFENLQVTNNVPGTNGFSQAKAQAFEIKVKMPDNFNCTGASTGDVCTVRCRNNAVAGPFGGCFAVQQIDTTAKTNTPANIPTLKNLDLVLSQVDQNQADFPAAVKANQNAGSDEALKNLEAVNAILKPTVVSATFTAETPSVSLGASATDNAGDAATTPASEATATSAAGDGNAGDGEAATSVISTSIAPAQTAGTGGNGNNNSNGGNGGNGNGNNNNNNNNNNGGNGGNGNGNNNNNNNNNNNGGNGRNGGGNNNKRAANAMRWAKRITS
ncbi:hypothetical protein S7711_02692 [Stachybotrys chartarum IBT 7711]|uniref:Gas1-like protein n=1 Tax=Stachybotrys chartarum (strain CBS 109288 / IBT 7711) TaxID=1280523 RepID=A0A084AZ03_STACB|nr:hypothetical protein S7711_02692 [Stachybotrys chartarum IBT 7711]